MKKELLPADATTIEALYERGDNLTFQWDIPDAMNYIVDLRREDSSGFWIASKTARLELDETCIQFFSDGTLVFSYMANPQKIERFEKIAAKKGFPVKRRLGSFSVKDGYDPSFMYEINCFANRKYHYQTDLIKVPEPEKQDFIDDLFSNGNVCLTACKILPFFPTDVLSFPPTMSGVWESMISIRFWISAIAFAPISFI